MKNHSYLLNWKVIMKSKIIKLLSVLLFTAILFQTAACGTILYPERRGQKSGKIDPAVVLLDGVGLLFFLVPGVIAFAVDLVTGAIYLPKGHKSVLDASNVNGKILNITDIETEKLDLNSLELIISAKTGKNVDLESGNCEIYQISDPEFMNKYFIKSSIN